ncbi:MAG: glutamate racemase [Desulfobulbus propionicus]|nr:MAG: glutamate racemase [Desulfobulbus propionicus]
MIGIFDSGLGGMTVARAIEQVCPGYPYLYFGDLVRSPYGPKSPEALLTCAKRNSDFLIEQGATILVIACNTAASTAGEALRDNYSMPFIDVVIPAVEKAVATTSGRIGVIGTRATIASEIYQRRIEVSRPDSKVYTQPCPLLVPLVEEGWLKKRETKMIVKKYLHPLRDKQLDTLILGCTHYPLLKKIIVPRIGKKVQLIDSSIETALALKKYLENNPEQSRLLFAPGKQSRFFVSDLPAHTGNLANMIFHRPVHLEHVHV